MIEETEIKEAFLEMQEYLVSLYPVPTKEDEKRSLRFRIKMHGLIEKHEHPIRHNIKKVLTVIMAFFVLSTGIILGFNEKARAEIFSWFREQVTGNEYHYKNRVGEQTDISQFTLEGIVPEGYQLIDKKDGNNKLVEIYKTEDGKLLLFTVLGVSEESDLYVITDNDIQSESVYVEGVRADLYISDHPDESSTITWQSDNGLLFSIQGILDKEKLLEMVTEMEK